jgi:hypothetical protein
VRKQNSEETTTLAKVKAYETTVPLLRAMYAEFQELSKKKPDVTLNQSKVNLVNRLLKDIREFLADEPDCKYLDILNDETLPQNSDVVLVLSQYSAAMNHFHERFHRYDESTYNRRWFTNN